MQINGQYRNGHDPRPAAASAAFDNSQFALCGHCDGGWVDFVPEDKGWIRRPEFDRLGEQGWISPGGVRYMHPRSLGQLVISELCDCIRVAKKFPLRKL